MCTYVVYIAVVFHESYVIQFVVRVVTVAVGTNTLSICGRNEELF